MKPKDYVPMSNLQFIPEMRDAGIFFDVIRSSTEDGYIAREVYFNAPDYAIPLLQWNGQAWATHPYRAKKGGYQKQIKTAAAFLESINQPVSI